MTIINIGQGMDPTALDGGGRGSARFSGEREERMTLDFNALSQRAKALGDPVRLRMLHLLAHEELSVGELVRILDLPQSTVSRQLKPLKEQGYVVDRPVGAATYYRAAQPDRRAKGEAGLRNQLLAAFAETALEAAEAAALARVLAVREREGGEEFFDRIGLRWDTLREQCFGRTFHLEAFLRLLPRTWTVADLGCGAGFLLPPLSRHFARVIGVDQSEPMLALSARRVEEAGCRNVELRAGRLEALPIEAGALDLGVALLMLHHLESAPPALEAIGRALKAGGRLLVVEIAPHENERFRVGMADPRAGLAAEELAGWLAAAGFAVDEQWAMPPAAEASHEWGEPPGLYGIVATKPGA